MNKNVKNGLTNLRVWVSVNYNCNFPTLKQMLGMYDNDWIVKNLGYMVTGETYNHYGYEDMNEDGLRKELDRLRSLKSNA